MVKKSWLTKIVSFSLCLLLIIPSMASATGSSQQEVVIEDIQALVEKYGFSVTQDEIDDDVLSITITSLNDLEEQLKKINTEIEIQEEGINKETMLSPSQPLGTFNNAKIQSTNNGNHTNTWWALSPFTGMGALDYLHWRNVSWDYTYTFVDGKARFSTVSNINSWISGISIYSWTHKNATHNIESQNFPNDKVSLTVTGYYTLGIKWESLNIGVTKNSTWTPSLLWTY